MEVILTHDNSDFDGVASAVAATKLYPAAQVVLGRRLGRDLEPFISLHKLRFPIVAAAEVERDVSAVQRVILVDVRRAGRLGHVPRLRDHMLAQPGRPEVHAWDHHPAAPDDVPAQFAHIERIGSATTLLVEEIKRRCLDVDVAEATLFMLGIHVDTGSLRYSGTTSRDAAAVAWLLDSGARLAVVNRFIDPPFSAGQQRALSTLLASMSVRRVAHARIAVAALPADCAVPGLDRVTSKALQLEDADALIAAYAVSNGAVQIVARSRAASVDVGCALAAVGGGGHAAAGAGVMPDTDAQTALEAVLAALSAQQPTPALVEQLMSSPVHSVTADVSVASLADALARWRHTGAPVVRDAELVGILSQQDVANAVRRGKQHEPVARHMSHPVATVEAGTTLDEALARMVAANVGRLPVMREGRMIGIVTRSDVLDYLYAAPLDSDPR